MMLLCTHHAVEFFVVVIRRAGQTSTVGFNMIELSTINIRLTARQSFLISIYTLKHGTITSAKFCTSRHQISEILSCPSWRAGGLGWDHEDSWSSGHVAHSTRYVVVMCSLQRYDSILCAMYLGISLYSAAIREGGAVLCVVRHAQVVGSTSAVSVVGSSSDSRVH